MITDVKIKAELKELYYRKGYWTDKTILDVWERQVELTPDKTFATDDFTSMTYAEINEKGERIASWLTEIGVKPGDVVTFQVPNWVDFCPIWVGIAKIGGVFHPLPKVFNENDLIKGIGIVGSKAFICPTDTEKTEYEAQAEKVFANAPGLLGVALIDKLSPVKGIFPALSQIYARYPRFQNEGPVASSDDVACILSTSGTTGIPKAALLTHNTILFSERSMVNGFELAPDDICFMPSPLNHAVGFFHGQIIPLLLGSSTVMTDCFTPAGSVDRMNEMKTTWTMAPTPFIYDILNYFKTTDKRLETLRLFMCGGAPLPSSLVQMAHACGITLCEIYGSTESCPHVYVPPKCCVEWNGAWSGQPFEGIEVRVCDDNDQDVECGVQGQELSRGPHLFVGYLNNEEANLESLTEDGWFRSGDLCYKDEQGRIRINGRKKEIIIRGGENLSANEIDANLVGCPGFTDHATIGMPDERLGERICTFVVPEPGATPTVESVKAYLAEHKVQKRLWPERIEYVDRIPRMGLGKTRRFELAEILKERMSQE